MLRSRTAPVRESGRQRADGFPSPWPASCRQQAGCLA